MTWKLETKTQDVAPRSRDEQWATYTTYTVVDEQGRVIATKSDRPATPYMIGGNDALPTALLIAAAPALRDALETLLAEVDITAKQRGWSGNGARVMARAALALLDAPARAEVEV